LAFYLINLGHKLSTSVLFIRSTKIFSETISALRKQL
jgi:hypothetical protein